jgi:hypothetical protein
MISPISTAVFLRWIDAHNAFDPHNYLDFVIEGTVVGAVHRQRLPLLEERPGVFHIDGETTVWKPSMFVC